MAAAAARALRAGEEDGPAVAARLGREGVTVAEAEGRVGANLASEFSHDLPHPSMPTNSAESFVNELKTPGGVKNVLADLNGAKGDINSAKTLNATKDADNAERNLSTLNKASARNTKLNNILQTVKNNPKKALAGVALTAIGAYAGARLDSTDGVDATITNITKVDGSHIQISYTPPNNLYAPSVNDQLTFTHTATTPSLDGPTRQRITQVIDNSTIVVNASITSNGVAPFGTMTVHSSFENQVVGSTTEVVATGANAIAQAAGVAAGAGGQVFCDMVPFLCNKTNQIIIGIICCLLLLGVGGFFLFKK